MATKSGIGKQTYDRIVRMFEDRLWDGDYAIRQDAYDRMNALEKLARDQEDADAFLQGAILVEKSLIRGLEVQRKRIEDYKRSLKYRAAISRLEGLLKELCQTSTVNKFVEEFKEELAFAESTQAAKVIYRKHVDSVLNELKTRRDKLVSEIGGSK